MPSSRTQTYQIAHGGGGKFTSWVALVMGNTTRHRLNTFITVNRSRCRSRGNCSDSSGSATGVFVMTTNIWRNAVSGRAVISIAYIRWQTWWRRNRCSSCLRFGNAGDKSRTCSISKKPIAAIFRQTLTFKGDGISRLTIY